MFSRLFVLALVVGAIAVRAAAQTVPLVPDAVDTALAFAPRVQVLPIEDAVFTSPTAGRIAEMAYREGDRVEAGATVLAFLCDRAEAELKQAKALAATRGIEAEASARAARLGTGSGTAARLKTSQLAEAEANVALAEVGVGECRIQAPFAGRLADVAVKAHYAVGVGQPLFRLVNNERLELKMILPARWLTVLETGTVFSVRIEELGIILEASLDRFGGQIDPVSQTIPAFATLPPGTDNLVAGMSGVADFRALLLDQAAVRP